VGRLLLGDKCYSICSLLYSIDKWPNFIQPTAIILPGKKKKIVYLIHSI
jgi:hypothetical protein